MRVTNPKNPSSTAGINLHTRQGRVGSLKQMTKPEELSGRKIQPNMQDPKQIQKAYAQLNLAEQVILASITNSYSGGRPTFNYDNGNLIPVRFFTRIIDDLKEDEEFTSLSEQEQKLVTLKNLIKRYEKLGFIRVNGENFEIINNQVAQFLIQKLKEL